MAFNSQDQSPQIKKTAPEMTAEFKPFWMNMLAAKHKDSTPGFTAKLCYLGKEFNPRVDCIRLFPSELSNESGVYIELYDWDFNFFHDKERVLYYLPYNPHWKSETDKYKEVVTNSSGKTSMSTFAVKLSDLTLVNRTPTTSAVPIVASEVPSKPSIFDDFDEAKLTDMFSNDDDDHYTKMTIRDLYCMLQNIPMSNKKWLNALIQKGNQWQQK